MTPTAAGRAFTVTSVLLLGLCLILLACTGSATSGQTTSTTSPSAADLVERGTSLLDEGQSAEALLLFEQAIILAPEDPVAWGWKGIALSAMERDEEAVESLDVALKLDPEWSDAWCFKGVALLGLLRYEEADLCLYRALVRDSDNAIAWFWRSRSLSKLDDLPQALVAIEKALVLEPNRPEFLTEKGGALLMLDRPDDALATLQESIKLDPSQVTAWCYKGNAQAATGWHAGALESFEAALAIDTQNGLAAVGKACSLLELERYQEAEFALSTALRLEPQWQEGRQLQDQLTALLHPTPPPQPTVPSEVYADYFYICRDCGYRWSEDYELERAGEAWYDYGYSEYDYDYGDEYSDDETPEPPDDWYENWEVWCPECDSGNLETP